ncbi:Replication-associated protein RepC [Enterococcus hirae]|nr:Replication-associated protein RepC [Enterococcus hirae]EMF0511918.1 Replication-associated protein RepC [Enterococcus hirae]
MVKQFKKDPSRKKITREIPETETSKPKKTFNIDDFVEQQRLENQTIDNTKEKKVGRPKKNKVYGTIRIQKYNVNRVNALQNTLDYETQDDLVASLLDRLENSMSQEQRLMFDMYMKTYEARNKKKENK